jgi:hypothetical protein
MNVSPAMVDGLSRNARRGRSVATYDVIIPAKVEAFVRSKSATCVR